jgi:putative two-component system response regulator
VDLAISDMVMPEMSGFQLRQQLQTLRPSLPVLLMSDYTEGAISRLGGPRPLPSLIEKPLTIDGILQRCEVSSARGSRMRETWFPAARILIVDDEQSNVRTLERLLRAAGYTNIVGTTNPAEVLSLYRDQDLMLLDLRMPGLDGVGVLEQLQADAPPHTFLPVLVLTGDSSRDAQRQALAAGAKDFVTKPFEVDEVLLRIHNLLETRYLHREITAQNQVLERRVNERTAELDSAYLDTLERLALAAEFRDDETGRHTERVGEAAALLGTALGLGDGEVLLIRQAGPLHDVGKIAIPDAVLRKPGPLTSDEWETMKSHAVMGAQILSGGRSRVMQLAEGIARFHHERWDGNGYPEGRSGEAILLAARLVMVADVFDALTSDRVYRKAWPAADVLAYIREHAGRRFDPQIAALCERTEVRRGLLAVRQGAGAASVERRRTISTTAMTHSRTPRQPPAAGS